MTTLELMLSILVVVLFVLLFSYDKNLTKQKKMSSMYFGAMESMARENAEMHIAESELKKAGEPTPTSPDDVLEECNEYVAEHYEELMAYDSFTCHLQENTQ